MDELDDFIVSKPYSPTKKEKEAIKVLKSKGLVAADWDSSKGGIKSYKKNLREYMYYEQKCRCAYCRIELPISCCFLQRDHIVHKDKHPRWLFEPQNLCIACDRCNNSKHTDEVLRNPDVKTYPTKSEDFLIVNPFLDTYSEHIEIKNDIIYVGKTDKGRFTINTCKLYHVDYAIERAKQKMKKDNPHSVAVQLLSLLTTYSNVSTSEINRVKGIVKRLVEMYVNKSCVE